MIKKFESKIRVSVYPIERDYNDEEKEIPVDEKGHTEFDKEMKVPSLYIPPKILKPFKLFVDLYGTTAYGELDPSFVVAFTYPLLYKS